MKYPLQDSGPGPPLEMLMDSAFCAIAGGEHSPFATTSAFVKDTSKNFSLRKRGTSFTFFTFEGFKKRFNAFPQVIMHRKSSCFMSIDQQNHAGYSLSR